MPTPVLERIRSRAEEAYPEECCGFLTGVREGGAQEGGTVPDSTGNAGVLESTKRIVSGGAPLTVRIVEEIPTENAAPEEDRRREFRVEPKALLDVMKTYRKRDEDVVGFYHSHPDHEAGLSPTDLEFARLWPRTVWLIVPVAGEEASVREVGTGTTGTVETTGAAETAGTAETVGMAGRARAWWLPGTGAGRAGSPEIDVAQEQEKDDALLEAAQEMIIRSSPSAERAVTPREEKV